MGGIGDHGLRHGRAVGSFESRMGLGRDVIGSGDECVCGLCWGGTCDCWVRAGVCEFECRSFLGRRKGA